MNATPAERRAAEEAEAPLEIAAESDAITILLTISFAAVAGVGLVLWSVMS